MKALRRRRDAGFTLVEMIVVMAVLALVLGLVSAAKPRLAAMQLDAVARTVAAGLRSARADAMLHGTTTLFVIDDAARRYGSAAGTQPMPPDVSFAVTVAASERNAGGGGFRFYPDGRSSGGRLTLTAAGGSVGIDVDWLTGQAWLR